MNKLPILETERLILRPMTEEDAEIIVSWRNDESNLNMMVIREKITVSSHLRWFRNREKGRYDYVLIYKENRDLIGTMNFTIDENDPACAESGKLLGNKIYRGKGLAKEGFKEWLRFGFSYLNLNRVIVNTRAINITNINLNIKLGFLVDNYYSKNVNGSNEYFYQMSLSKENFNHRI